jgi:uncharacterized repeat protein (TIGR01451 family)
MILWWPFNGGANDFSNNGYDALVGGPYLTADRYDCPNSAYYFSDNDSIVQSHYSQGLNNGSSTALSISLWFESDTTFDYLFALLAPMYTETNDDYSWSGLRLNGDSLEITWYGINGPINVGDSSFSFSQSSNIALGNGWHHIVWTIDEASGESKIYHNGILNASNIYPDFFLSPRMHLKLGGFYNSFFQGKMDDIGVWKRALDAGEVEALYNGTNSSIGAYRATDSDCYINDNEIPIPEVQFSIEPGSYVSTSGVLGLFSDNFTLPDGSYSASIISPTSEWLPQCDSTIFFNVNNGLVDGCLAFQLYNISPCASPEISITCPTLRLCSQNAWPIYVSACNRYGGTGVLENAYVLVQLDDNIIVDAATTPAYTMENSLYRFELGNINPGECIDLVINANFSCDLELGETLCMEATLYPVPDCLQDTVPVPGPCELPWDHSSLSVEGECDEDTGTISFTIENSGEAMVCESEVRVYVDGDLFATYYIQLGAESDTTFTFPTNGGTWILQADQHPLHPGNSHPNDHVEGCGDVEGEGDGDDDDEDGDENDDDEWEPGLVDDLPCGDESPFVDEFCGQVVGSFDPNDKQGFPNGVGETRDILPNEQLQYLIRFQNTGTAPAYTVVIRDTLDTDLDIFSVTPGASSHDYSFTMYGERVLQWTFNNIMLPDSFSNEEGSHGFITYTVNQVADLADGAIINNSAAIYFDSNEPVITNTTLHTINYCLFRETNSAIDATTCDVYTAPDGQQYSQAGTYTAVLTNAAGCDSTITIHLSAPVFEATVTGEGTGILTASPEGLSYQWYDCATNQPVAANGTGMTFEGSIGSYYVEVSNGTCTEQSQCAQLVGVNELSSARLSVFPIPASQQITVAWTGNATNYTINTPDGRLLQSGRLIAGANTIDISTLAAGTYFLKAGSMVSRFVVK